MVRVFSRCKYLWNEFIWLWIMMDYIIVLYLCLKCLFKIINVIWLNCIIINILVKYKFVEYLWFLNMIFWFVEKFM